MFHLSRLFKPFCLLSRLSRQWILLFFRSLEKLFCFAKSFYTNRLSLFRNWDSTSCNTTTKYRYNASKTRGEIIIVKEFGQQCKKCNRMVKPRFDIEATEKALSKIIERIKKSFYNQQPANDDSAR